MYINVAFKDMPELSNYRRNSSDTDLSVEKTLLVNPNCLVRIMLEYIRKTCRLGKFTTFDLCDENGVLMGLFSMPTYVYATDNFVHKKTYYIIVMKQANINMQKRMHITNELNNIGYNIVQICNGTGLTELDKTTSVLPQLNRENVFYEDLKNRVKYYLATGEMSPLPSLQSNNSPGKITPLPSKASAKKK